MLVFQKLESCYDQMLHPQKRSDVLVVLELVMLRVVELRHLMVKWNPPRADMQPPAPLPEMSFPCEYVNLSDVLEDMKLPPETLEVPVPRYFRENNAAAQKLRDRLLSGYCKLKHGEEGIPLRVIAPESESTDEFTMEQVIEVIQRNERGRQGKFRGLQLKAEATEVKRLAAAETKVAVPEDVAASEVQRLFRGHRARLGAAREREDELVFLGMKRPESLPPARDGMVPTPQEVLRAEQLKRKTEQAENKEAYAAALVDLKEEVRRDEGPLMKDRLRQERHLWVTDKIAETKDVPSELTEFYVMKYPALPEAEPEEAAGGGKKGKGGKDDKKKKDDKKGGKKKKAADDAPPEAPPALRKQAEVTTTMFGKVVKYRGEWQSKDESYNFSQKHDVALCKAAIRVDVEAEVRDAVDEMLLSNLAKIKAQLAAGAKAGKKKGAGKKKKGKGGKGGKKKKGKGKGKPLPGEKIGEIKSWTPDEMLADLIENKLVNTYIQRRMTDIVGGGSAMPPKVVPPAPVKDEKKPPLAPLPLPSMAQIRNALTEYAVLPLGCGALKAKLEDKVTNVKALMLYGPAGSGKTMMVEAVCSELGAMLVNISPDRLAGLYQGKQGPTKLMHLIYKISAENAEAMGGLSNPQAPVVVYMDECERFFEAGGGKKAAKVKVDKAGPIRFKKDLLNYMKIGYKPPDRVIFIGTTRSPEKADKKDIKAFFDKVLYVPYPDYPTRLELWKSFCDKQFREGGDHLPQELPPSFDLFLTTLARISEGFTAGEIEKVVKRTLTKHRLLRLEARPLEGGEFLNHLALEATRIQTAAKDLPKPIQEVYGDFTNMITGFNDREKKIAELSDPNSAGGGDKKKGGKKKK